MSIAATNTDAVKRIVVGVDGSKISLAALAWAARQAVLTAAPLTVVAAWFYPTSYGSPIAWSDDVDLAAEAKVELDASMKEILGSDPGPAVTASVVEGHPALVLVDESRTASLLVVGCSGHGEFAGMLLGSVSAYVSTHASCPVLIFRGDIEGSSTP